MTDELIERIKAYPAMWRRQEETRHAMVQDMEARLHECVKPLEWEDFDGRGAKATAWGKANYLITRWSDGRFDLVESYPGYQGDNLAGGFLPTLEAAKAAAQAHYAAQIIEGLDL